MNETIPDTADITKNLQFHETLNTELWQGMELRLEVRVKLLEIAQSFLDFLDVGSLGLQDIIMTGSNVNYNYTRLSDVDVHLVVPFSKLPSPKVFSELFSTKKRLWGLEHNIKVHGYDVELYVENADEPAESSGVYSLLRGKWLKKPSQAEPKWDDPAIVGKVNSWVDVIDDLLRSQPSAAEVDRVIARIRNMRQTGLESGGEFATENLAFKCLRALGYIDALYNCQTKAVDRKLTLEQYK